MVHPIIIKLMLSVCLSVCLFVCLSVCLSVIPTPPFLGASSVTFTGYSEAQGGCQGGFHFLLFFGQNWNNSGCKGFLGGDIPSIGEESDPRHVDDRNLSEILKGEESLKNSFIACHKTYY